MPSVAFSFEWEVALMVWLQSHAGPALTAAANLFTELGEDLVLIALVGFIYWCWDKNLGKRIGFNLAAGLAFSPILKNIVIRRRPYFDHSEIRCLRAVDKSADLYDVAAQGYSFPSMHAADTMNFFGSLAQALKRKWGYIAAGLITFMVGLSRVILGVHYPTDVLAGWIVGIVMVWLVTLLQKKVNSSVKTGLILLVITLPGWFFCKSNDYFSAYGILAAMPLSFWLEERKVHFENTKKILPMILRVAGGLILFEAVGAVMKLPFSKELLESMTFTAYFIRFARYFVSGFVILGLYPMAFRFRIFGGSAK